MTEGWGKIVAIPTQWYGVPPVKVGKIRFDPCIEDWWCTKSEVECGARNIFQKVILQHTALSTGAKKIRACINEWLRMWKQSFFYKLINDSRSTDTNYLTRAREHLNTEQRHWKFSSFVLRVKLCEPVRFVCKRDTGWFVLPNEPALDKSVPTNKTVTTVLVGKYPHEKILQEAMLES